jgi:hypothetical protein
MAMVMVPEMVKVTIARKAPEFFLTRSARASFPIRRMVDLF